MSQNNKIQKSNIVPFVAGIVLGGVAMVSFMARRLAPDLELIEIHQDMLERMVPVVKTYAPPEVYAEIQEQAVFHDMTLRTKYGSRMKER